MNTSSGDVPTADTTRTMMAIADSGAALVRAGAKPTFDIIATITVVERTRQSCPLSARPPNPNKVKPE